MPAPNTREILEVATRYVILKTGHGITVGLHVSDQHYGEGYSPANDLDAAVHSAYHNARGAQAAGETEGPAPTRPDTWQA